MCALEQRVRQRSSARSSGLIALRTPPVFELDWTGERPLTTLRDLIPSRARARLRPLLRARPRWGNLRRSAPFSDRYGYDRGTPVDRYFIEQFLDQNRADVRGSVAEIKSSKYTDAFGGTHVSERHVIDIDSENPAATIVADLAARGSLPTGAFDCFILTQTLHLLSDPSAGLANAYQSLRPGGRLLVTVPSIARVDPDIGDTDLWRFTPAGLFSLISSSCERAEVDVAPYGSLVTAVAFLEGLAAEELAEEELRHNDPSFVVLCCGRIAAPS